MPPLIMGANRQQGMAQTLAEETPLTMIVIMLKLNFPVRQ